MAEGDTETALLARLDSVVSDPSEMVMITSIGQPFPTGNNPNPSAATGILNAINRLGGTPDLFARATGAQTYSLVGIAGDLDYGDVAEQSSVGVTTGGPTPPGDIYGTLARGIRNYAFEPDLTSPTQISSDVFNASYRPATPWPHSGDPGYADASAYIAQKLFPNANPPIANVRDEYDNTNIQFPGLESDLTDSLCTQAATDIQAECTALLGDYRTEFNEVGDERNFFTNLKTPFTDEAANNFVELNQIEMVISKAVPAAATSTQIDWSDLLATIQGVADVVGLGELIKTTKTIVQTVANAASGLSALLGVAAGATALGTNGDGGATADDNIETTAGKLQAAIAADQTNVEATLNNLEDAAVLDAGRLNAIETLAVNIDTTEGTINAVEKEYKLSPEREFMSALVTTHWTFSQDVKFHTPTPTWITSPGEPNSIGKPSPITDMRDYYCAEHFIDNIHPFNQMAPSTEYAPITTFSASGAPLQTIFFIVVARLNASNETLNNAANQCLRHWPQHDFASGPVFSALFGPPGSTVPVNGNPLDDVGFVPAQWWWQNFSGKCWKIDTSNHQPQSFCSPNPNNYTATNAVAWSHANAGAG